MEFQNFGPRFYIFVNISWGELYHLIGKVCAEFHIFLELNWINFVFFS
jgi:hypothetical protein